MTRARKPKLTAAIVEVRVIAVLGPGLVEVVAEDGLRLEARCPQHIDLRWLRAALSVGPVDGAVAFAGAAAQAAILWCVFPGAEHRFATPDVELRGRHIRLCASEGVEIECGRTALQLDPRGSVRLRGQNVACDDDPAVQSSTSESKKPAPN